MENHLKGPTIPLGVDGTVKDDKNDEGFWRA